MEIVPFGLHRLNCGFDRCCSNCVTIIRGSDPGNRAGRGKIGSSLQAEVVLHVGSAAGAALKSLGSDLRFVLITSAATVEITSDANVSMAVVTPSAHAKCARCWHYRADVGSNAEHATICGRCVGNLFGEGEKRVYA